MNIEYLRALKEQSGFTEDQIADLSGVPKGTVTRILAGRTDNPGYQNVADIVKALHGSLDAMEMIQSEEKVHMETETESKLILLYREIVRNKDKWIKVLAISVGVLVAIFILLFLYDILNPTVGWFRH